LRQGVVACAGVLGVLLGMVAWRVQHAAPAPLKGRAGRSVEAGA